MTVVLSQLTLIFAIPFFIAVITPFSSTVATELFEERKVGVCPVEVVTFNLKDWLRNKVAWVLESCIVVGFTVMIQLASCPFTLAVIFAVPAHLAVITPYVFTLTILDLLLLKRGCLPDSVKEGIKYSSPIDSVLDFIPSTTRSGVAA